LNTQKVVFVVDDDPSILKSSERLLKAHGFQARFFVSAEDFEQNATVSDGMCLILDIHLSGRSGIELGRELIMSQVPLPVIFITGDDSAATRSAAYSAGCVAFLTKPFSANSLLDAIVKASLPTRRTSRPS
jgi:FixJ family two-component response regulator